MSELILNRDQVRDVDRRAAEEYGVPGIVLMENAGRGAAEILIELGAAGRVVVCAGKGNNGGDGFVIARHLESRGLDVRVLLFCKPDEVAGDAAANLAILQKAGTPLEAAAFMPSPAIDHELAGATWIVDALLGTGTRGVIRDPYATAIDCINQSAARKLAVDVPSGLDCDTGRPLGCAVRADHTVTFVAKKLGFTAAGADTWTGTVHVVEIGLPRKLLNELHSAPDR